MDRDQRIRDPIHNLIGFSSKRREDRILWQLIQTPPVQRLRRIKQLGFSEFVYPGATHSRFSHVLGAMHMARRMLDVFEKTETIPLGKDHEQSRLSTLAAALLHDVGHGPYSHVFEDVSSDLGLEQSHEEFTLSTIEGPDIKPILKKNGIFEQTKRFFTTEAGYDPFSMIISSQMDCDRLDFLVRDRYHTGIRSAAVDLEWLFDSLRIDQVPIDPVRPMTAFSFVVLPKGVSVVEEFVLTYMRMYQGVYFHKTTRAIQHMVIEIIKLAVSNAKLRHHPLVQFFRNKRYRSVEQYARLDDYSILSLIRLASDNKCGYLTKLATRFFSRDVYKCIKLPTDAAGEIMRAASQRFIQALNSSNIEFIEDRVPAKHYKQYDVMDQQYLKNILVKKGSEYEPLGKISHLVRNIPPTAIRIYFRDGKERERARKILQKCMAG
jgi:uncharacterized protein